jgi:SAM-dependent methyltransferase
VTVCIKVFDSSGEAYKQSFQVFLENTDQKARARRWLENFLNVLPRKRVLIDAGAGSGEVTAWLSPSFEKTIAIEPNPFLLKKLVALLPDADVICKPILDAAPSAKADLVLCSHTFYYLAPSTWMDHLERILTWIEPAGNVVIVLQHHDTDCMRMLEHFCGHRFNLSTLVDSLKRTYDNRYNMQLIRDDAYVVTADFQATFIIAEFMLNLLPLEVPPPKAAVESYIRSHFLPVQDGYRFSCHQDFLHIRRA